MFSSKGSLTGIGSQAEYKALLVKKPLHTATWLPASAAFCCTVFAICVSCNPFHELLLNGLHAVH
jgi:hypothetical protein